MLASSSDAATKLSPNTTSALCVIVDCSVGAWASDHEAFATLLDQLLAFLNAFHLLSASNQLLLMATHPSEVLILWPPGGHAEAAETVTAPVSPQALRTALLAAVKRLAEYPLPANASDSTGPLLSAALATGLCRMQRARRVRATVEPRFLVIHASADAPAQHLASMNCVFAAVKLGILIDAVVLAPEDSMVLQQASHLTGGLYVRPDAPSRRALAQYLITCVLPDRYARQFVRAPEQGQPETRALCFLTQKPVEIGHACSVCLAVFSHDKLAICPVCSTRFAVTVAHGQARKRLKKNASAVPSRAAAAASSPTAPPDPARASADPSVASAQ